MAVLTNYPNISQLSARINPQFDCVAASIADGIEYLTGSRIDIDVMVTACYGPNYHGATSASRYVAYCAGWGVHLYPIDGDNAALVADLHKQIQAGHPCLITVPDKYAPAHPDWSHCLSVYGEVPGELIARDPYSTRDVSNPDSVWITLLEFHEVWAMEALDMVKPLSITDPAVAALFVDVTTDTNHPAWKSKATGRVMHDALLKDYIANGQYSLDYLGDILSPELDQPNGTAIQFYASAARVWTKATGKVERFDVFSPTGQDILRQLLSVPAPAPEVPQEHALLQQLVEEARKLGIS